MCTPPSAAKLWLAPEMAAAAIRSLADARNPRCEKIVIISSPH
jgi:hypothetical protein